ncbi:hypothetical protein ACN42_g10035 [Penicillium freii]|uniref:Uncharacterized protein n=1 Tax=Penicillium freii TaxID=48697 RepID=A0A101MAX5_PENFR|nr:hypothetical protein ACN42_g10035 [Penicillium freii]
MARQSGRSNQNNFQGMNICHIVQNMLTAKYKGLASAGYQHCRVPGDWVESKPAVCIGDDKTKARGKIKNPVRFERKLDVIKNVVVDN